MVLEMNFFSNCYFVKIMRRNLLYQIFNFHIANSALNYASLTSGDVSVSVSTIFFREKNGKYQNSVSRNKKIAYNWFPQGMRIFPGGVRQKCNFRRGNGVRFKGRFCKVQRGGGL